MSTQQHRGVEIAEIEAVYRSGFQAFLYSVTAIVGDVDIARDAVHDAFAAAIRRRASYRAEGKLEAWLWRIVINTALDVYRERAVGEQALSTESPVPSNGDQPSEANEAAIRAAVSRLSERQRLVVFLRYYADLGYAEIGEVLDISPGTVGSTLNAARAELLRSLDQLQEVLQ
jgi:RNA polymerase sigma-70 factor, ECF subfamily